MYRIYMSVYFLSILYLVGKFIFIFNESVQSLQALGCVDMILDFRPESIFLSKCQCLIRLFTSYSQSTTVNTRLLWSKLYFPVKGTIKQS